MFVLKLIRINSTGFQPQTSIHTPAPHLGQECKSVFSTNGKPPGVKYLADSACPENEIVCANPSDPLRFIRTRM